MSYTSSPQILKYQTYQIHIIKKNIMTMFYATPVGKSKQIQHTIIFSF